MPRKLPNNKKKVNKPTWCIVYHDGVLISFIEYSHDINTSAQYFDGTKEQCIAERATLGLDTTKWDSENPEE